MTDDAKTSSGRPASCRVDRQGLLRAALGACVLAILLLAPAAQASKAVIGTLGTPNGEGVGRLFEPKGIAVNRSGAGGVGPGEVYVVDSGNNRIAEFSASGAFVRAFGYDVVAAGPDNTGVNQQQTLSVDATGGTFTLETTRRTFITPTPGSNVITGIYAPAAAFHVGDVVSGGGVPDGTTITAVGPDSLTLSANMTNNGTEFRAGETTAPIPHDATAAELQAALESLPAIGAGNVAVSDGPGASLTIEYTGALGRNDVFHVKSGSGEQGGVITADSTALSGGGHTATLATTVPGGGYEVCEGSSPGSACKAAPYCGRVESAPEACEEASAAGSLNQPNGVAIDQATGNVYVTDTNVNPFVSNNRVNVYSADGAFEGAFGWNVNATSPEEKLQFCTTATGCQSGSAGGGAGQLAPSTRSLPAVDPSNGHLYVPTGSNNRIDEFAPAINPAKEVTGVSFVKAFGYDVVESGPDNVTPVNEVQTLSIPASVTGGKFTISFNGAPTNPLGIGINTSSLFSALNGLSSVKDAAGSITVVSKGTRKWELVFGGEFENEPVPEVAADSHELVGGEAVVSTISEGVNVYERCDVAANPSDICKAGLEGGHMGQFGSNSPSSVAVDSSGAIYASEQSNNPCRPGQRCRVLKFNPAATSAEEFSPAQLSAPFDSDGLAVSPTDVAVDPTNDHVLVAKKEGREGVKFFEFDSSGTLLDSSPPEGSVLKTQPGTRDGLGLAIGIAERFYFSNRLGMVDVFGPPPAPSVSIGAVTNPGSTTATFHGTVTPPPPGPGGESFETTYHFEYSTDGSEWSRFPAEDVSVGNGSGSGPPGSCPVNNPPTCEVVQNATGLQPGAEYEVRLVATTGTAVTSASETFTTEPGAPSISGMLAEEVAETSAKLTGFLNPNNSPTTYHFEYGTDTGYGNRIPAEAEESAGSAGKAIKVSADLSGLKGGTAYHFRIVAANASGESQGADREFSTLNSAGLPDGRAPEQVSPNDKRPVGMVSQLGVVVSSTTIKLQAATDGEAILYPLLNGLPDSTAGGNLTYLGRRSPPWKSTQMTPPSLVPPSPGGNATGRVIYASADLSCQLVESFEPLSEDTPAEDIAQGVRNLYRRNADGTYTLMSAPVPLGGVSEGDDFHRVYGVSTDCEGVLFDSSYRLLDEAPTSGRGLYEWSSGTLRLAAVLPDGSAPVGDADSGHNIAVAGSGALQTTWNSLSSDGSKAFFTAVSNEGGDKGKRAIFMRRNGTETVDVSQSQTATPTLGAKYQLASADGSHVFFVANYGLTATTSIGSTTSNCFETTVQCDLYDYDTEAETLTDLSADAKGAGVIGLLDASDDGSAVYFAARGQLVPSKGKTEAQNLLGTGAFNVYRSHAGTLSYVGLISSADAIANAASGSDLAASMAHWVADATPDGEHLLFVSKANVTGYESGGVAEIYRYAAQSGETVCVSCRADGLPSVGDGETEPLKALAQNGGVGFASAKARTRAISDDGRKVFFAMPDVLAAGATEGTHNIYEWSGGQVSLLASGEEGKRDFTEYADASASGDDVFVVTKAQLVPQDFDNTADLYDLRAPHVPGEAVGPEPAAEQPQPCDPLAGKCQGEPSAAPSPGADPGSKGFSGPGNPPIRKACRKGAVRVRGKCVKRKSRSQHKSRAHGKHKRAHTDKGRATR
jgi:hypothetical protein